MKHKTIDFEIGIEKNSQFFKLLLENFADFAKFQLTVNSDFLPYYNKSQTKDIIDKTTSIITKTTKIPLSIGPPVLTTPLDFILNGQNGLIPMTVKLSAKR